MTKYPTPTANTIVVKSNEARLATTINKIAANVKAFSKIGQIVMSRSRGKNYGTTLYML